MNFDPEVHHRGSIRLRGYDYSQGGAYFLTICTNKRQCLFGKISEGRMQCNEPGLMIESWYKKLEGKFPNLRCDSFVCMPNHIHFIILFFDDSRQTHRNRAPASSIDTVVQWLKTMTTNEYIKGVKQDGWQRFSGRLWQRNYWEHVIRGSACTPQSGNESELAKLKKYIQTNPAKWEVDRLNGGRN
jgi:REP-associated tyrosine transposase